MLLISISNNKKKREVKSNITYIYKNSHELLIKQIVIEKRKCDKVSMRMESMGMSKTDDTLSIATSILESLLWLTNLTRLSQLDKLL